MSALDEHADAVAGFYKRLTDGGVPGDLAAAVTVEVNKGLLAGAVDLTPDPQEQRSALAATAEVKRKRREQELASQ